MKDWTVRAADWKAKCQVCNQEFQFKDGFDCKMQDGKHTVETRTYYHLGGRTVNDEKTRRFWAPLIILRPAREGKDPITGEVRNLGGLSVQFGQSGVYTTSNPDEQFYLDTKLGLPWGNDGLKEWQEVYYTPQQLKDVAQAELVALRKQIEESNSLLEATKAQQETNSKRSSGRA